MPETELAIPTPPTEKANPPPLINPGYLKGLNRQDIVELSYRVADVLYARNLGSSNIQTDEQHKADSRYLQSVARTKNGRMNLRGHLPVSIADPDDLWITVHVLYPKEQAEAIYGIIRRAQLIALAQETNQTVRIPEGIKAGKIHQKLIKNPDNEVLKYVNNQQLLYGEGACFRLLSWQLPPYQAEKAAAHSKSRRQFLKAAATVGVTAATAGLIATVTKVGLPAETPPKPKDKMVPAKPTVEPAKKSGPAIIVERGPESIKTPEKYPSLVGRLIVPRPDFFVPGTDRRIEFAEIPKELGIKGYGSNYRFAVNIHGQDAEIPIGQIDVVTGEPIAEGAIKRHNFLGIRVDDPGLIKEAAKLGVGKVRITVGNGDIDDGNAESQAVQKAIQEAKARDLEIVLVFQPDKLLEEKDLEKRFRFLFSGRLIGNYEKVIIELGNEPDNGEVEFWEKQDLKTFARFVKRSTDIIWTRLGQTNTKIMVGALTWPGRTDELLGNLRETGFDLAKADPKKVMFAVHTYNTISDLQDRMDYTKAAFAKYGVNIPIWITELGTHDEYKQGIVKIIDSAKSMGIAGVLIHELPDMESFGFWDVVKKRPNPYYWLLQYYTQYMV